MVEGAERWRLAQRNCGRKRAGLVSNPFDLNADYGLATYDVRNVGVINAVYDLPLGNGKRL